MPAGDHPKLLQLWRWRCAAAAAVTVLVGLALPAAGGIRHVTFDQSDMSEILPCVEELTPCQGEMKQRHVTPACCRPLSNLIRHNPECICAMFFSTDLLDNFNLTRDRALEMAIHCRIPVSVDYCSRFITPEQADEMHRLLSPSTLASLAPAGSMDPTARGCPRNGLASALPITVIISSMIFFISMLRL